MIKIDKILFPTDFSDFSKNAMKYAISFAQEYKAKLLVQHVIESVYPYSGFSETTFPMVELQEEMEKHAQEELELMAGKDFPEEVEVEIIMSRGAPFLEIVNMAKEKEVDLIVIATHGRSGLEHAFFGSTAEKVVRKAQCPVLTIKHPEHEFVHP